MAHVLVQTPTRDIQLQQTALAEIKSAEVLVRFMAAPINPLDLLVLAGTYPVKPKYRHEGQSVLGYDGIGEVQQCGAEVHDLQPGDLVVPSMFGIGTWRTHAILQEADLHKVQRPSNIAFGAILKTGVQPAYLLVQDMTNLKPGDWLIQNAATSVIAQMVVQFAKQRGVGVISVIRDRDPPDVTKIKHSLVQLGADECLTETELVEQCPRVRTKRVILALDSVFGASGRLLLDCLATNGTFVQLGFLGGVEQDLVLGCQHLFSRNIILRGFRGTQQIGQRTQKEREALLDWFIELFNAGRLVLPSLNLQTVEWDTAAEPAESQAKLAVAIDRAKQGLLGQRKQIIVFI